MKIVQINGVCGIGSTGRIAQDLSLQLNEQKIENYIFYGFGKSDYPNAIKFGNQINIRLHQIFSRITGKHGLYSYFTTYKMINKLKKISPDIVHLHNIHGFYLNYKILFNYLNSTNIKIVWTFHDCWPFTGHCAYFDYTKCDKWKTGCFDCKNKKEYPISYLKDSSKYNYELKKQLFSSAKNLTVVTPSQWLADLVKQSNLKEFKTLVINNGINLDVFKPTVSNFLEEHNIQNKFVVLGICSALNDRKGGSYLIELAKKLGDDCIVAILGLNQNEGLPKNVITISRTNSTEELAKIYSMADVYVNPTLEDNFPTTNIEALACGTPVITFKTGGSVEAVDEKTGLIVNQGDVNGLYDAVMKIKNNTKAFYSENCRKKAEIRYSKEERYKEYIKLYEELI